MIKKNLVSNKFNIKILNSSLFFSFKYMNSICTVCKKWNGLIRLVIAEEVESRLKSKLLIEVISKNPYVKKKDLIKSNINFSLDSLALKVVQQKTSAVIF